MTDKLEIYFSDLTDEAKQEVLEFFNVTDPSELNMGLDLDMVPIFTLER